jgi:hypothetical protein
MTSRTLLTTLGASTAAIALGTLGLAAVGSAAHAATHHPAGADSAAAASQKFTFVTAGTTLGGKPSRQVGLFHGAINGGGKDVAHAQSDRAHLSGGGITVKHPDKTSTFVPKIDPATCYATFTLRGTFTLTHGTGRYHGVHGSGTYVGHGYGYLARKKNGTCNTNAEPKSEIFQIVGKGTLR